MAKELSAAQCVLLTVHYATEANIRALHAFTPLRLDALSPELVLRIVLTFVPESVDPSLYTTYVREVATRLYLEQQEPYTIDTSPVASLSPEQAQKRVDKLQIAELSPPAFPPYAGDGFITRFVCHRSSRIDRETGLLTLVPRLAEPFLESSEYLRTWYVSLILPLLRLRYQYYPNVPDPPTLDAFEKLQGSQGIDLLLSNATHTEHHVTSATESEGTVARDVKGLVGPWMYGHTERQKRRRLSKPSSQQDEPAARRTGFIKLDGVAAEDKTGHDWEYVFRWMVHEAAENFPVVTNLIEEWDGPGDVDLGGFLPAQSYLDEETQTKLERQYAQAAFASCYSADADTSDTIDGAHGILVRLAQLLDFKPPPELATTVKQLPKVDKHAELLHAENSDVLLEPNVLLKPEHPLASPKLETYMLLQMLVYSAYQLAGLGHRISILNVTKLRFSTDEDQQLALLLKILHGLAARGKRDDQQWQYDYDRLIWLWNWNIEPEDNGRRGAGIFGKIEKTIIERELLKVLVASGCYTLIDDLCFARSKSQSIDTEQVQQVIHDQAMQLYDNASNGNRTRGSMKKASDLINYCQRHYPQSAAFRRATALVAATHAMSFYSLILQHGVPFQPVNIRASSDPLSLLPKLLEQNASSYTKLDDLIGIGRNLIAAGLPLRTADGELIVRRDESESEAQSKLLTAERRVIYMCVEAALSQGDFETAYSYVVNRLAPSDPVLSSASAGDQSVTAQDDDISWRAAFLAGRFRAQTNASPTLRRLDQRTELLSLALLLAPSASLSEVLGVWRRCEEETNALLAAEDAAEEQFDDRADKRRSVPGGFADVETEGMVFGQPRREVGRSNMQARRTADDEAPIGLFDVARGAAKAFSRNAFPLRASASAPEGHPDHTPMEEGMELASDGSRVRRRDMVANAVTGGLASGIGWMLGAPTVDKSAEDHR